MPISIYEFPLGCRIKNPAFVFNLMMMMLITLDDQENYMLISFQMLKLNNITLLIYSNQIKSHVGGIILNFMIVSFCTWCNTVYIRLIFKGKPLTLTYTLIFGPLNCLHSAQTKDAILHMYNGLNPFSVYVCVMIIKVFFCF